MLRHRGLIPDVIKPILHSSHNGSQKCINRSCIVNNCQRRCIVIDCNKYVLPWTINNIINNKCFWHGCIFCGNTHCGLSFDIEGTKLDSIYSFPNRTFICTNCYDRRRAATEYVSRRHLPPTNEKNCGRYQHKYNRKYCSCGFSIRKLTRAEKDTINTHLQFYLVHINEQIWRRKIK